MAYYFHRKKNKDATVATRIRVQSPWKC